MSFAIVLATLSARANEGGGEAAPAPASHGGGGGSGSAEKSEPKPWAEVQARMLVYKGQRQQMISDMKKIVEEKRHLKMGSAAMSEKAKELVTLHKQYKETTEEYNKLLFTLRYRFPERLTKNELKDQHTEEVLPLEQMETQMDLDSRLTQIVERARDQYPDPEKAEGRQPSLIEKPKKIETPNVLDAPPILLRK